MKFALRTKLFALTTFVITLVMAAVAWFLTLRHIEERRGEVEAEVARVAKNLGRLQLLGSLDWDVYENYLPVLMQNRDIVYVAIYDERNAIRAHALNPDLVELPADRLSERDERDVVRRLDRGDIAADSRSDLRTEVVAIEVGGRVRGSVHVGFSLIAVNRELAEGVRLNVLIAVGFVVFSGVLSFFLSRRLTRPLERLSLAMRAIAAGDLDQEVVPETYDEIGDLAETFNRMAGDLRERQIGDRLAGEMRSTFQLDRLASLVGDRLAHAVGAGAARLYLRRGPVKKRFECIGGRTVEAGEAAGNPGPAALTLRRPERAALRLTPDGAPVDELPEAVQAALAAIAPGPAALVVPMLVSDEVRGLLVLEPGAAGGFDERNRQLAAKLASQATLALENALLYEELREQDRMRGELQVARAVQQKLLPRTAPTATGFELDGLCRPATEVGGDYYDFLRLDDDHLGVVIADVSGKGASASLYMAELKGMMLSLATLERSPRSLLVELDRHLGPSLDRKVFVSMLYGVLDAPARRFTFARAGHSPLLHVRAAGSTAGERSSPPGRPCDCQLLAPPGIALGLSDGPLFEDKLEETSLELRAGDAVVLVTDGVTEAMSPAGETFGNPRLLDVVGRGAGDDAVKLRTRILEAVDRHVDTAPRFDDLTLVVIRSIA